MINPNSRLRHRSTFVMQRNEGSMRDPLSSVANLVLDWVQQKEGLYSGSPVLDDIEENGLFPQMWEYAMPGNYAGGEYNDDRWPALATACARNDADIVTAWALEYDEPDSSREERRWHTTVCLERIDDDSCTVSIESVCRSLDPQDTDLPETISAPSFVKGVLELAGFVAKKGTTPLAVTPIKLRTHTFERFKASLLDPGREVPLVLFSTGYDGKIPEQSKQLARRALGTANVYVLDYSDEPLRNMLLKLFERDTPAGEYACPRSSCRMYLPGIDITNPHRSMSHESFNREAMSSMLPSRFAEGLARRFIPSAPVKGIGDIKGQ